MLARRVSQAGEAVRARDLLAGWRRAPVAGFASKRTAGCILRRLSGEEPGFPVHLNQKSADLAIRAAMANYRDEMDRWRQPRPEISSKAIMVDPCTTGGRHFDAATVEFPLHNYRFDSLRTKLLESMRNGRESQTRDWAHAILIESQKFGIGLGFKEEDVLVSARE